MSRLYAAPRLPRNALERRELDSLFDADRALTIVRGPDGLGKTAAVAQWVARLLPEAVGGIWVSVDGDTSSRPAFWRAVFELLGDSGLLPRDERLRESIDRLDENTDRYLLVRTFTRVASEMLVVVDNFHLIAEPAVTDDILHLLENCPRLRIVLITRSRMRRTFAIRALGEDAADIDLGHHPFRPAEVSLLVRNAGIPDEEGAVARAIHEVTHGVPISVRVLLSYLAGAHRDDRTEDVAEIVATRGMEVLRTAWRQGLAPADFVAGLRLAVAENLTEDLATRLTGRRDADSLLDAIAGLGLGMWRSTPRGEVLALSKRVRRELLAELDASYPDETVRRRRIYAQWCLENRLPGLALDAAVRAGDLALAETVTLRHWRAIIVFHRDAATALIPLVSRRRAARHPLLTMLFAVVLHESELHRAQSADYFRLVVTGVRLIRSRASGSRRVLLQAVETAALRFLGRYDDALVAAEKLSALLPRISLADQDEIADLRPVVHTQIGLSLLSVGRLQDAVVQFDQAASSAPEHRTGEERHALALRLGTLALSGLVGEAEETAAAARIDEWEESGATARTIAIARLALAMIAIDKGDPAAAEEHLATLDLRRLTPELRSVYAAVRGLADLLMGRYVLGAHRLAAAAAKRAGPPVVRLFTDTVQSLLLLAADRPRAARAVLADHSPQHPLVAATRARVELHLGHAEKALAVLATVNDEDMPLRVRCTVALVTATAKTRLNRDAEAAEAVSGLLAHMQEAGLHLPLLLLSRSDREAVVRAVEDNVEGCTAWLRDLVDAPDLVPERHQEIRLTERELVVLDALVRSGSLSEIAEELFVSVNTVKSQVRSVYRKFGVNRREDALRVAGDHGLLPGLADDD